MIPAIILLLVAANPALVPAPGSPIAGSGSALAAADVNADGCADLLQFREDQLQIYLGSRERSWPQDPDQKIPIGEPASEVAVADFNGDGRSDLALTHHDTYEVRILLCNGQAGFRAAEGSPYVAHPGDTPHTHGVAVADIDGNGTLDLVTANNEDAEIGVLLGDGRGGFKRAAPIPCGKGPYPIAATDLDSDGRADVIVPNSSDDLQTLHILRGATDGLEAGKAIAVGATVWFAATGDLNQDGRPDVVATHSEGGSGVSVLLNEGQSLQAGKPVDLDRGAWGVAVVDMDHDTHLDLVIAANTSIQVLLGNGRGEFSAAAGSPFPTGRGAWRSVVADFNGDGKQDVATNCVEAQRLEILYGQ